MNEPQDLDLDVMANPRSLVRGTLFTIVLLLVTPKIWVVMSAIAGQLRHGHRAEAIMMLANALIEVLLATIVSPILAYDSIVAWVAKAMGTEPHHAAGFTMKRYLPLTMIGFSLAIGLWWLGPAFAALASPIWAPCLLSVPLAIFFVSPRVEEWIGMAGILATEDTDDSDAILGLREAERRTVKKQLRSPTYRSWFDRVIRDDDFREVHCELVGQASKPIAEETELAAEVDRAVEEQRVDHMDADSRKALLESPDQTKRLAEGLSH